MRIGVEASALADENRSGVAFYTHNVILTLAQLRPEDTFLLPFFRFCTRPSFEPRFATRNIVPRRINLPRGGYNSLFRYAVAPPLDLIGRSPADVYIFPNFLRWPLAFTDKSIVIVHDLSYVHSAEHSPRRDRALLAKYVPRGIAKAQAVVTISENSRREIVAQYGVEEKDVVVAYPGVDHDFFYPRSDYQCRQMMAKYGLRYKGYLLYVGTIQPRKNIANLLRAYQQLSADVRAGYPLVLAGGKGWLDGEILSLVAGLSSAGAQVIQTGYTPYEDLPGLYSGAKAFAYPSHYEGFGMSPLEAMACGTPVVVSEASSLPEVVGKAGMMINPRDVDGLRSAIQSLLLDDAKCDRLSRLGVAQAKRFLWQSAAAQVSAVIDRVTGDRMGS